MTASHTRGDTAQQSGTKDYADLVVEATASSDDDTIAGDSEHQGENQPVVQLLCHSRAPSGQRGQPVDRPGAKGHPAPTPLQEAGEPPDQV